MTKDEEIAWMLKEANGEENFDKLKQIYIIMESEKAKDYIEHQYDAYKDKPDETIAFDWKQFSAHAVNLAEGEMKEKAIEALSSILGNWVHGGDADCIIAEFEEKLDK